MCKEWSAGQWGFQWKVNRTPLGRNFLFDVGASKKLNLLTAWGLRPLLPFLTPHNCPKHEINKVFSSLSLRSIRGSCRVSDVSLSLQTQRVFINMFIYCLVQTLAINLKEQWVSSTRRRKSDAGYDCVITSSLCHAALQDLLHPGGHVGDILSDCLDSFHQPGWLKPSHREQKRKSGGGGWGGGAILNKVWNAWLSFANEQMNSVILQYVWLAGSSKWRRVSSLTRFLICHHGPWRTTKASFTSS